MQDENFGLPAFDKVSIEAFLAEIFQGKPRDLFIDTLQV